MDLAAYLHSGNFFKEYTSPPIAKEIHQGDIIISPHRNENIQGILIITNECDLQLRERGRRKAIYVSYCLLELLTANIINNVDRGELVKILGENSDRFFYLPPHSSILSPHGCLIACECINSLLMDEFFLEYPRPPNLRLIDPYLQALCSKIGSLFSRVPVNQPEPKLLQKWINDTFPKKGSSLK